MKTLPHPEIRMYRDASGDFRWTLVATNRKKIADGAEGYKTRAGVKRAVRSLILAVPLAVLKPI